MPETPDELLAKGNELLSRARGVAIEAMGDAAHRLSPEGRRLAKRRQERRNAAWARGFKRVLAGIVAVLVAALGYGLVVGPIGLGGFALMILAMVLVTVSMIVWSSSETRAAPEQFAREVDIARLPSRTESWLEQQRPALPAPARRQVDAISLALEQLSPQLSGLDPREPAALEVRRLIGEELPELVRGYQRVPEPLRRQPLHGGPTPDAQVTDGLATIKAEIDRMSASLASGELHALATQQRYLELKYRGDQPGGDAIG